MADSLGDWQRCVRRGGGHEARDLTLADTQASFVLWAMVLSLALVAFLVELVFAKRGRSSALLLARPRATQGKDVPRRRRRSHRRSMNLREL